MKTNSVFILIFNTLRQVTVISGSAFNSILKVCEEPGSYTARVKSKAFDVVVHEILVMNDLTETDETKLANDVTAHSKIGVSTRAGGEDDTSSLLPLHDCIPPDRWVTFPSREPLGRSSSVHQKDVQAIELGVRFSDETVNGMIVCNIERRYLDQHLRVDLSAQLRRFFDLVQFQSHEAERSGRGMRNK
ncbi:hypothetical protein HG530_004083 [Fusarium avenaceum]|nr:hypothetical protein HG530_004083 [Fusarium avenaceum]